VREVDNCSASLPNYHFPSAQSLASFYAYSKLRNRIAHPVMLRAAAAAKMKNDRIDTILKPA
jgi:hypothetical protein